VYTPLVGQKEATRSEIRHLVSRFFKNSHEQLVLNLLEDQGIGSEEIGRLREMLAQHDMVQHDAVQSDPVQKDTIQKDAK
jgi:predicted transcriptional regulator